MEVLAGKHGASFRHFEREVLVLRFRFGIPPHSSLLGRRSKGKGEGEFEREARQRGEGRRGVRA